jgi:integrase
MSVDVFKPKGCKVWHYRFQLNGKRVQRTTREASKTRAEAVARRAYDAAVARDNGGQPMVTLREIIKMWLEVHRPIYSAHHIRTVDGFARLHLYDLGDKRIDAITTADVESGRNQHLQSHRPASANQWLRILKLLMRWAVRREIIPALPWNVALIKVQKVPRALLPVAVAKQWLEEVDKLSSRTPRAGAAVRLMFGLGLRESEAISARWEWLDWSRQLYTPGRTKGKEADALPVPGWLIDYLEPLRQAEGLIAVRPDGRPFVSGFARWAMQRANETCGISGITPHRLRGTFATLLSESGVPVQTIQRVMRHKHLQTTLNYLEVNLDLAAAAQKSIGEQIGFRAEKTAGDSKPMP